MNFFIVTHFNVRFFVFIGRCRCGIYFIAHSKRAFYWFLIWSNSISSVKRRITSIFSKSRFFSLFRNYAKRWLLSWLSHFKSRSKTTSIILTETRSSIILTKTRTTLIIIGSLNFETGAKTASTCWWLSHRWSTIIQRWTLFQLRGIERCIQLDRFFSAL